MSDIFDYSQYHKISKFSDRDASPDRSVENFFLGSISGLCPFCNSLTTVVHSDQSYTEPDWLNGGHYDAQENVEQCTQCGWWRLNCVKVTTGTIDAKSIEQTVGVLKKYDIASKSVPIASLQNYLRNNPTAIIGINDKKMEELVKEVFSEYYSCDVRHVGKSHDGGIDLILVDSDDPTVIQVKRRKTLPHTEAVSCVREFLGAALLAGARKCIYVSTSSKFSERAVKAARGAEQLGLVESYELQDFDRLVGIIRQCKAPTVCWREHLRSGW